MEKNQIYFQCIFAIKIPNQIYTLLTQILFSLFKVHEIISTAN